MSLGFAALCILSHCLQLEKGGSPNLSSYIGSNACRAEVKSSGSEFGLALDRKQLAYLEVREINGAPTLLLVQYANSEDHCGTIRDIVVASNPKDLFEFECTDHVDAKKVVIGVHPNDTRVQQFHATKAWAINFGTLELVPTNDSVSCVNYNYAGSDDGSDIRSRAVARAKGRSK
jgi:hypothetical protein